MLHREASYVRSTSHPHHHARGVFCSWSFLLNPYAGQGCLIPGFYVAFTFSLLPMVLPIESAPLSLLPQTELGSLYWSHPIPKSCIQHFLHRIIWEKISELPFMWSDYLWKLVIYGQFLPSRQAYGEWRTWFPPSALWARKQPMPYKTTKLEDSPGGWNYLLLGKASQLVKLKFPLFSCNFKTPSTTHSKVYFKN